MPYRREVLMEVWRVTQRGRDGSIKKTVYVEDRWVTSGQNLSHTCVDGDRDLVWAYKSTSFEGETARSVKI